MSAKHRASTLVGALVIAMTFVGPSPGVARAGQAAAPSGSRWFPLQPGTEYVYDGAVVDEDGMHTHRVVFVVTDLVKWVDGRRTVVAWDRDYQDGALAEAELALFALDKVGDVMTLGEYPEEYENGRFAGAPSTWVSGRAGAKGGILVPGHPRVETDPFVQGRAPRVDFYDVGQVVRRGAHVCVPAGCFDQVTVVEEWSPLAPEDGRQLKYYAPGVGLVKITADGGDSRESLTLTRVRCLGPAALAAARAETLRLDQRGHRFAPVWSRTPAAHRR